MTYRVFVSCSKSDVDLARDVAKGIQKVGAEPFIAEAGIEPGQNWLEEVRRILSRSDEMVIVLSKDSIGNEWVNVEMGMAFGLHKLITPITSNLDSGKLPPVVRALPVVRYYRMHEYLRDLETRVEKTSHPTYSDVSGRRGVDSTYEMRVAEELNSGHIPFDRHPKALEQFRPDFAIPSSKEPKFFLEARENLTKTSSVGWLNYYARFIKSDYPQVKIVVVSQELTANTRRLLSKYWNYVFSDSEMDKLVELLKSSLG